MKDSRKYILIALGICILAVVMGATYFLTGNSVADENTISCCEWIEMLTEQMGIQEDTTQNLNFDGEDSATGQFIALTAMKTIGESKLKIGLGIEDVITDDVYLELALEHGLVEKKKLKMGFTREECERVLETLKSLYFSEFWKDDYSNVVYQDDVIELSPKDVLQSNVDGSKIMLTGDVINSCNSGNIIVFTQENTGLKLARKITGINADGTLTLDTVELDEVVETLTVSDITEITFDDIVNYYSLDENLSISDNLLFQQHDMGFIDVRVFSGAVNSEGYKISVSTQGEDEKRCIAVQITNNATGITYTLPISEKVEREDDYAAEINIDKIYIGGQVDYSLWDGLKYAEAAVDAHATFKSEIKAEKAKKIPLLKTPVPLGNGFIGADVEIYLVLSLDGSISFEAELPIEASVSYDKNRGLRNFKHDYSYEAPKIEVNCNANAGLQIEPILIVFGGIEVMDIEIDIGVGAGAKVTTQPNSQICAEISISFPFFSVAACGDDDADTIIGNLGFSKEWEIISPDDAPIKKGLHYELVSGKRPQFVKECTYEEQEDDTLDKAQKENDLQKGTSQFKKINAYNGPIDLWINAPFEDAGEYYIVKGNLQIPYAVLDRDFNKLHQGDQFSVLDKEFVLGEPVETEDFPARIYAVYCANDDCTYYIQTKVALDYGSMYSESYYPICRSISDYDAITESMEIINKNLGMSQIEIAKDTYITSLIALDDYSDNLVVGAISENFSEEEINALVEESKQKQWEKYAHTAEECFEEHILFDDWLDIANFSSVYGELEQPIHCYTAFDENGEIDIIVWDSFG